MKIKKPTIVGQFFLSFPSEPGGKRKLGWQGQVLSRQEPGIYLVQLYEWLMGGMSDTVLVSAQRMVDENWDFYEHQDDWRAQASRISKQNYSTQE